jgi:hypothetical protein
MKLNFLFIFLTLFNSFKDNIAQLNINQANIGVWLSSAAYCGKESYNNMILDGPAYGFVVKDILYDPKSDVEGYIGILDYTKTIHIVFRGSSSIRNWIDDFEFRKIKYETFPECNCKIHKGFYSAVLNLKDQAIHSVRNLINSYNYSVICNGHSLGASLTQIMCMELEAVGIKTSVYNYGQPRVGDENYAQFSNSIIKDYYRFTHYKDIVPHVPPNEIGYYHSCDEIYENYDGLLHKCSLCEDSQCADQFKLIDTNIQDHYVYLGHKIDCNSSVKFIFQPSFQQLS